MGSGVVVGSKSSVDEAMRTKPALPGLVVRDEWLVWGLGLAIGV
jgi:hypothetical protein